MKRLVITAISLLTVAAAARASVQTLEIPTPGAASSTLYSDGQRLIGWRSGPISCAGSTVVPRALPAPFERFGWIGADGGQEKLITLTFDIDRTGRPHAIKRDGRGYAAYSDALEPTLATATFPTGTERTGCSITYTRDVVAIDTAPIERLIAYSLLRLDSPLPRAGYDRVQLAASADSTCFDPGPKVRRRSYPDFDAIPQQPGTRSWSMIGFDIDRQGRPVRVRVFRSTGNDALDRASVRAVADSRFEPGARRGCLYPYWRKGPTIAAPAIPDELAERADGTCPVNAEWKAKPFLRFPEPYRRQGVEGWGVVAYDVAPWGQTGNLRVIASEPSEAFGKAALETVSRATKEPSARGYSNCLTRVRFRIAPPGKPGAEDAKTAPPLEF